MSSPILRQPELFKRPARTPSGWDGYCDAMHSFSAHLSASYDAPVDLEWAYPGGGNEPVVPCQCARVVSRDEAAPAGPRDPDAEVVYAGRTEHTYQDARALGSGVDWYREYHAYAMYRRANASSLRVVVSHVADDFERPDEDPVNSPWGGSGAKLVGGELVADSYSPAYHTRPKRGLVEARLVATIAFRTHAAFGFGTTTSVDGPRLHLTNVHLLGASPYDWHLFLFKNATVDDGAVVVEGYLPHPLIFGGTLDVDLRVTASQVYAYTTYGDAVIPGEGANGQYVCARGTNIASIEGWW